MEIKEIVSLDLINHILFYFQTNRKQICREPSQISQISPLSRCWLLSCLFTLLPEPVHHYIICIQSYCRIDGLKNFKSIQKSSFPSHWSRFNLFLLIKNYEDSKLQVLKITRWYRCLVFFYPIKIRFIHFIFFFVAPYVLNLKVHSWSTEMQLST